MLAVENTSTQNKIILFCFLVEKKQVKAQYKTVLIKFLVKQSNAERETLSALEFENINKLRGHLF